MVVGFTAGRVSLRLALTFVGCLLAGHGARADGVLALDARGWWPPGAQQRFAEAKQLAQQGRYADASEAHRSVAEWPDGTIFPQRAEASFLAALMQEHSHNYERAIELYREVAGRFPG